MPWLRNFFKQYTKRINLREAINNTNYIKVHHDELSNTMCNMYNQEKPRNYNIFKKTSTNQYENV